VISIKSLEQSRREVRELLASGKADSVARINFVSWDLVHKVLAPNRMEIVQTMVGAGPLSIREVARRVGRDFKGVHTDVTALLKAGVMQHAEGGGVVFPYDSVHVEFDVSAAA